ncbi:hypothetical protein THAR02_07688 [Trichoderma harzianum]|uniref:LysR family regulatory protein n=1 Tax=Trichoderma harzianum TaxID=5544 RepID=A0A0F9ZIR7_TRIHA|nr:hypothetical protein THAR02_07688 [Trichoderma harzianum]
MGFFSAKHAPPPIIPTDEVIPLRFVDELYRFSFDFTLVFRDVMDAEMLRASADRLLQKDGWRQLGARLRRAKNGRLEYHLPTEFTEERPLFLFTSEEHDMSIDDHPGLRNLPKTNGEKPTIFEPSAASFRPYTRSPTTPQAFEDWLYNDIPQLSIHVVKFQDATIITVTLLHTLTDMMGLMSFYRAWLATLRGEEDQIPPYIGYKDKDPLEGLHQGKQPPRYIFADRILNGWGFFKFVVRNMFDRWWYPDASLRFISLPEKFVGKLTASARKELVAAQNDAEPSETFISDSDVLNAWWTRLIIKSLNPPSNRTVCLTNNFDCRDILAKMGLLPSSNISFLANAVYSAPCFIPAGKFVSTAYPLGLLANQVRNTIKVHRTVEQVQAQDAAYRESKRKTGHLPLYGDANMLLCPITNCYRGKLFQMDFSPAVIVRGDQEEKANIGRPVFINCTAMESRWATRNGSAILGKSNTGDWWLSSRLRLDIWKKIEEQFETL